MATEIYMSMNQVEASWVLAGLVAKRKEVIDSGTSGGGTMALQILESLIRQILHEFYNAGVKIMTPRHPLNYVVKAIDFKPIVL